MNGGHIEQAGAPRDIFNAPRTAFVAQFMGGHNVIPGDGGKIAVRADRLRLTPNGRQRLSAVVRSVEYQGTHVQVMLTANGAGELTATLSEAEFDSAAMQAGQQVAVDWSDQDGHRLAEAV
jgi:putative spermidine/putrescine transport system ATP-binding protein